MPLFRTEISADGTVKQIEQDVYKDADGAVRVLDADQVVPEGWVEMQGERPTSEHVAQEDGAWILVPPVLDPKLIGVEFQGVMCSATKEDMWGLSAVAPWVQEGNSTAFEFDNGNVLVLTPDNYRAFTAVWGAYRASFFPVP